LISSCTDIHVNNEISNITRNKRSITLFFSKPLPSGTSGIYYRGKFKINKKWYEYGDRNILFSVRDEGSTQTTFGIFDARHLTTSEQEAYNLIENENKKIDEIQLDYVFLSYVSDYEKTLKVFSEKKNTMVIKFDN
jgi:hypothetical protein